MLPAENTRSLSILPGMWWSLSAAALFAATFDVWRPVHDAALPHIPLFGWGLLIPRGFEWIAVVACGAAIVYVFVQSYRPRRATAGFLVWALSSGLLIAADQLRFQPWWIHLFVAGAILSLASPRRVYWLWTLFLVSMYGWSAWSKWDYSFIQSHGRELVAGLMQSVGINLRLSPAMLSSAAVLLPMSETIVAGLLLFSTTRRVALFAAIGMHLLLGLALGPTGLNHSRGVLVWNAVCLAQLVVLIVVPNRSTMKSENTVEQKTLSRGDQLAMTILGLVMVFPSLASWGSCDPWWAWELYASRPAYVDLSVSCSLRANLPPEIRRYVVPVAAGRAWCHVRIDKWALEELSVPVAPGARLKLAIAAAICERHGWDRECRVDIASAADRLTGTRTSRTVIGIEAIRDELRHFRLNVQSKNQRPDE